MSLNNFNHSAARQGDYFFPLLLSFVSITTKEISDINNIPNEIIKEIA
jgi:hypothetical protein